MTSQDALSIAQQLIRFPSVTPHDGGALGHIANMLQQAGFQTEALRFSQSGTPDIDNLYARIGTGAPYLLFAGHTDVVPVGDASQWRFDPFSAQIADDMLWGRGACDMKGGLACALAAVLSYVQKHGTPQGSIGFLLTGDEEGPAINGTVKLLEWAHAKGERFDHCILGEPTNPEHLGDMIKIGRRGSLSGGLVVHGRQGHVGYPHLADNPIHHILRIMSHVLASPLDQGTAHFDPSNLEFTSIDVGNPATNVIPAEARTRFNIRFNDVWTPESLAAHIRERVATAAGAARYTLSFDPTNALAFLTKPGRFVDMIAQAIEVETGRKPVLSTTGGTSDARFIKSYCEVVEFGLVGQTMHMVDERVPVGDFAHLAKIYERIIASYFSTSL